MELEVKVIFKNGIQKTIDVDVDGVDNLMEKNISVFAEKWSSNSRGGYYAYKTVNGGEGIFDLDEVILIEFLKYE